MSRDDLNQSQIETSTPEERRDDGGVNFYPSAEEESADLRAAREQHGGRAPTSLAQEEVVFTPLTPL